MSDETTESTGAESSRDSTRPPGSLGLQLDLLKCQLMLADEQIKHNRQIREHAAKAHEEWKAVIEDGKREREADRQRREQMIAEELARADKIIELLSALAASANGKLTDAQRSV